MTAPQDRAGLVRVMAHAMRRRPATVEQKAEAALAFLEAAGLRVVPESVLHALNAAHEVLAYCVIPGRGRDDAIAVNNAIYDARRAAAAASPFAPPQQGDGT